MQAPPSRRNVPELAKDMQAVHDAVMPLIQPNVREHNWVRWLLGFSLSIRRPHGSTPWANALGQCPGTLTGPHSGLLLDWCLFVTVLSVAPCWACPQVRLTRVFEAYGSEAFLTALMGDPAYERDREEVLANFKVLVRPYEAEMTEVKAFQRRQAESRRARMERMTAEPYQLRLWLEDVHGSVLLQEWLRDVVGPEATHLLLFLRAVDYFRGTANRALLSQRAAQVKSHRSGGQGFRGLFSVGVCVLRKVRKMGLHRSFVSPRGLSERRTVAWW